MQIMTVAAREQRTAAAKKTRPTPYSPMKSTWIEERLSSPMRNCQKSSNMSPMDPKRIPNARGSLTPPSTAVRRKKALGEKAACLAVFKIPSLRPTSARLSHGGGIRPCRFAPAHPRVKSKRSLQRGQVAHRTPGGILSSASCFEYPHLGQVTSSAIFSAFPCRLYTIGLSG